MASTVVCTEVITLNVNGHCLICIITGNYDYHGATKL